MKATLTIEVPDDFKKGDLRCRFRSWMACTVNGGDFCNADNCPLGIQYEHISCGRCTHNNECYEVSGSDTCRFEPIGE